MACTFNKGESVVVGSSIYPAKFVRQVDDVTVEVEWPESGRTSWERFFPLDKVKPMSEGRRRRKKTDFFTENDSMKKKCKVESNDKAAAVKKNGTISNTRKLKVIRKQPTKEKPMSRAEAAAQAYQASQTVIIKQQEPKRRTRKTASKTVMSHAVSIMASKLPAAKQSYFSHESESDGITDDSLLAEARAVRHGRYLSSSDDDDDDRNLAAKPEEHSGNNSDDELDLARTRARQDWNNSSSRSDNGTFKDRKRAARPMTEEKEYSHKECIDSELDNTGMRESEGSSSGSSNAGASESEHGKADDELNDGALRESGPIDETEPKGPPQTRPLKIGDHVVNIRQ